MRRKCISALDVVVCFRLSKINLQRGKLTVENSKSRERKRICSEVSVNSPGNPWSQSDACIHINGIDVCGQKSSRVVRSKDDCLDHGTQQLQQRADELLERT